MEQHDNSATEREEQVSESTTPQTLLDRIREHRSEVSLTVIAALLATVPTVSNITVPNPTHAIWRQ